MSSTIGNGNPSENRLLINTSSSIRSLMRILESNIMVASQITEIINNEDERKQRTTHSADSRFGYVLKGIVGAS